MTEKKRMGGHFPLTIDPLGGVLMRAEPGGGEIGFSLRGEGGLGLTREVIGADWRVCSGEGQGRIDIQAKDDSLTVSSLLPLMILSYSRAMGELREALVSGVDLAALAGMQMALARNDWSGVGDLKQARLDRLLVLTFAPGGLELAILEADKREVVGVKEIERNELGADEFGFLPGKANYSWADGLGFLKGRVGFEVFSDRLILFYEKKAGAGLVRQPVMEVPRTVPRVAVFDRKVTQGLPSEDDLINFVEELYLPRI